MKRPRRQRGIGQVRGETHGHVKLTDAIVTKLRAETRGFGKEMPYGFMRDAAARHGVSVSTIHGAIKGKSWRHLDGAVSRKLRFAGPGSRKPKCKYGHSLTDPKNVRVYTEPDGTVRRDCRACGLRRYKKWYQSGGEP